MSPVFLIEFLTMHQRGILQRWVDDKAYGFIRPEGGGQDVFVHVRDFGPLPRRPKVGDVVRFQAMADGKGRFRAADVSIEGLARSPSVRARASTASDESKVNALSVCVVLLFIAVLGAGVYASRLPGYVPLAYLAASGVTFLAYAVDKSAAMNGRWRVQEDVLQLLALAGGWPGALLAQGIFKHKTRKTSFQVVFWASVVINLAALGWLAAKGNSALLASSMAFG